MTIQLHMGKNNLGKRKSAATPLDEDKLRSLMPMDLWIYKYATSVFNARYDYFKNGVFNQPARPEMPKTLPCQSTRYILSCSDGPLSPLYHVSTDTPKEHLQLFEPHLKINL